MSEGTRGREPMKPLRRSMLGVRISTSSSSAPASQGSAQPAISCENGQKRVRHPRGEKRDRRAPGICFAIRAFARIRICRLSATRFVRGRIRTRSPMAPRFCAIWTRPRKPSASTATFVSASGRRGRRGDRRMLAGRSTWRVQTARRSRSRATFSSFARAITNMRKAIRQAGQARSVSLAASCIRRTGPKTCVTTASGWSLSAAARQR